MRSRIGSAALALPAMAALAFGQGKPAPEEQTGPGVGTPAPKFTLKDQAGQERRLDDLLKGGPVALVFFRSADW